MMGPESGIGSVSGRPSGGWRPCLRIGSILLSLPGLALVVGCAGRVPVSGLRPHYPEASLKFVEVDSLQPTLSWEAFPRPIDLAGDKYGIRGRISNVTYDLRIWQADEESPREYPAEIAYARRGLREPWHTVEQPLMPSTMYFWSVRARFELDGQPRVTQWGVTYPSVPQFIHVPHQRLVPHPDLYRFETPSSPTHPLDQIVLSDAEELGRALAREEYKIATTMPQETRTAYLPKPESGARTAKPVTPTLGDWLIGEWIGTREGTWERWGATIRITSYDQATHAFKGDGYLVNMSTQKLGETPPTKDLVVTAVIDEKGGVVMTTDHSDGKSFTFNLKRTRDDRLSGMTRYGPPSLSLEKRR